MHYLPGWDRVTKELPTKFDLSIIVDASTYTLLEKLAESHMIGAIKSKPCIVLDHHTNVERPIDFAAITICDNQVASTGELIYHLGNECKWPLESGTCEALMASILGDTQGLTNDLTHASTYRVMAELVDRGADRPKLEDRRREYSKMPAIIYAYKGELLRRTEFVFEGKIASVTIPQSDINTYSPLYNPGPLVQFDMLQVSGVQLAIVFKSYDDGKITAGLRSSNGYGIAGELAAHFGGGGHPYASGFKITDAGRLAPLKANVWHMQLNYLMLFFEAIIRQCLQDEYSNATV